MCGQLQLSAAPSSSSLTPMNNGLATLSQGMLALSLAVESIGFFLMPRCSAIWQLMAIFAIVSFFFVRGRVGTRCASPCLLAGQQSLSAGSACACSSASHTEFYQHERECDERQRLDVSRDC
jgi:hypothetical protein